MRPGAGCEEALPGAVLGGIAVTILTYLYGNGWTKFSKNVGFLYSEGPKTG